MITAPPVCQRFLRFAWSSRPTQQDTHTIVLPTFGATCTWCGTSILLFLSVFPRRRRKTSGMAPGDGDYRNDGGGKRCFFVGQYSSEYRVTPHPDALGGGVGKSRRGVYSSRHTSEQQVQVGEGKGNTLVMNHRPSQPSHQQVGTAGEQSHETNTCAPRPSDFETNGRRPRRRQNSHTREDGRRKSLMAQSIIIGCIVNTLRVRICKGSRVCSLPWSCVCTSAYFTWITTWEDTD